MIQVKSQDHSIDEADEALCPPRRLAGVLRRAQKALRAETPRWPVDGGLAGSWPPAIRSVLVQ